MQLLRRGPHGGSHQASSFCRNTRPCAQPSGCCLNASDRVSVAQVSRPCSLFAHAGGLNSMPTRPGPMATGRASSTHGITANACGRWTRWVGVGAQGPLPPTAREQQRHRGTATRQQLPRSCPADSTMTRGTRALAERLEVLRSCPRRGRWSSYFLALTTHWHL